MTRRTSDFQTIRSEGGLLPPDLLRRVLDPREKLAGTHPEDYGLPPSERLNDIITQSWNRLRKHWAEFRTGVATLPGSEVGTGLTNEKWSLPLLRELGFGLLPTSAGPEVGGRTYAINRFFGPVPVHLVGCGVSLDKRSAGVRGAATANPHGLVKEFLNRSDAHDWAIVSATLAAPDFPPRRARGQGVTSPATKGNQPPRPRQNKEPSGHLLMARPPRLIQGVPIAAALPPDASLGLSPLRRVLETAMHLTDGSEALY